MTVHNYGSSNLGYNVIFLRMAVTGKTTLLAVGRVTIPCPVLKSVIFMFILVKKKTTTTVITIDDCKLSHLVCLIRVTVIVYSISCLTPTGQGALQDKTSKSNILFLVFDFQDDGGALEQY